MVQTGEGAARNEWITYMRTCAANYHAAKVLEGQPDKASRRVKKGKPKAPKKTTKPASETDTGEKSLEAPSPKGAVRSNSFQKGHLSSS